MFDLSEYVTISMTTHILPSTNIIEECIASIRDKFIGIDKCKFIIYCDSNKDNQNHSSYINSLSNISGVDVVDCLNDGGEIGLKKNYIKGVVDSETPFIFCCEHDWIFLREIDLPKLIKTMLEYDFINFVRFNKRDNKYAHINNPEPGDTCFLETYVQEDFEISDGFQKLMKTNAIATHPHIIRKDKFVKDWLSIAEVSRPDIAGVVESNLQSAYESDIRTYGIEKAQRLWGIYNYGSSEDLKIIKHTDGSNSGRT